MTRGQGQGGAMERLSQWQIEEIERINNVIVDADTMSYNLTDNDYGWQAIPQSWIDEVA